ncbi:hypothetical protein GCM10028786_30960 [Flaviaesturariibacter terrae]
MCSICLLIATIGKAQAYGRIVINEYMPWPSASCGTTSEFVELLNFGPGPTNIGCYILTTGTYSVTIPPNTILQPGQFYVIAGQSSLPRNCGNIDSAVTVHLNWNTCNCTNVAIPTSGDGFMVDGGTANVNLVLFDPTLKAVDAVTRAVPVPTNSAILSSSVSNGCTRKTFTLSSMSGIDYEQLGMSTGKANSFARKLDGDCEWIKQPQISAGATNNKTSGGTASLTYQFNIVNSMDLCTNVHGSINVSASGSSLSTYFPLNYTLAYDMDGNNVFDFGDIYTYGSDATAPDTTINGLVGGSYIVTVGSSKGCNLKSFPFSILPCQSLLPIKLLDFGLAGSDATSHSFQWRFSTLEGYSAVILESSSDGRAFHPERSFQVTSGAPLHYRSTVSRSPAQQYRLRLIGLDGRPEFSRVVNVAEQQASLQVFPNPVSDRMRVRWQAPANGSVHFSITSVDGRLEYSGSFNAHSGVNEWPISAQGLKPGIYQLTIDDGNSINRTRFVKQ